MHVGARDPSNRRESWSVALQIAQNLVDLPLKLRGRLKSVLRLLGEHFFQEHRNSRMEFGKNIGRERMSQVLIDHTDHRTVKRRAAGEREPERRAERIDVRPNIDLLFFQLLRAGKMWCTDKSTH